MSDITKASQENSQLPTIPTKGQPSTFSPPKKIFQERTVQEVTGKESPCTRFTPSSDYTASVSDFSASTVNIPSPNKAPLPPIIPAVPPPSQHHVRPIIRKKPHQKELDSQPLAAVNKSQHSKAVVDSQQDIDDLLLTEVHHEKPSFLDDNIGGKSPISALLRFFSSYSSQQELHCHEAARIAAKITYQKCLDFGLDETRAWKASCFAASRTVELNTKDLRKNNFPGPEKTTSPIDITLPSRNPQVAIASAATQTLAMDSGLPSTSIDAATRAARDAAAIAFQKPDFQTTLKKTYQAQGASNQQLQQALLFDQASMITADVTFRAVKAAGLSDKAARKGSWKSVATMIYDATESLNIAEKINYIATQDHQFPWPDLADKILRASVVPTNDASPEVTHDISRAMAKLINHESLLDAPTFAATAQATRSAAINATRMIVAATLTGTDHATTVGAHNTAREKVWRDTLMEFLSGAAPRW